MRYFSRSMSRKEVFTVEGTSSFPGEITSRIQELIELPGDVFYDRVFDMVFENKRSAREWLQGALAPSDYRLLNEFRLWLARLDRGEQTSMGTVHIMCNLNKGYSLVFIHKDSELDGGSDHYVHANEQNSDFVPTPGITAEWLEFRYNWNFDDLEAVLSGRLA